MPKFKVAEKITVTLGGRSDVSTNISEVEATDADAARHRLELANKIASALMPMCTSEIISVEPVGEPLVDTEWPELVG